MKPSESGAFFDVVTGAKYDSMLLAVSFFAALSILPLNLPETFCNPMLAEMRKTAPSSNDLRFMSIIEP
jgi:hypothetical protein